MEYQSFGRPQRPKGANIKQALKVMVVLAVCAWLVYQIKHSIRNKTENYGSQTRLIAGNGAISLGRKGTQSRWDERVLPDSGNVVDSSGEAKGSTSGWEDVFDGAKEDKAEEEFGHINDKFRTNDGKEVELEPERQPKVSSKNKYKDSSKGKSGKVYIESRKSESGQKEHGIEKYPKRPVINDPQSNDKETEVKLRELRKDVQVRKKAKSDFSAKENDEDEDPSIREKENVVESATNGGVTEGMDEIQSFHDENGVPPDCNETEIVFGQAHVLHEENNSNFSKRSRLTKSNIYGVTTGEDNNGEVTLEGSKNDATVGEEINTGTSTHVDASGINRNSEIDEGDSLVL